MAKRVYYRWTTPVGVAVWPKLYSPNTQFDPDGFYECGVKFSDPKVVEEVKKRIRQFHKEAYELKCREEGKSKLRAAKPPYKEEDDGSIVVKTKLRASGIKDGKPWTARPAVFDSRGNLIKTEDMPKIGGGSVVKVAVDVVPYLGANGVGISMRLKGVQLITLVEYGAGEVSAEGMGFTSDEEGYIHGGESFPLEEASADTESDESVSVSQDDADEVPF